MLLGQGAGVFATVFEIPAFMRLDQLDHAAP